MHGYLYGTSSGELRRIRDQRKVPLLDIDVQGCRRLYAYAAHDSQLAFNSVFVMPPSVEILEARLRGRATDAEEAIKRRIENAHEEIRYAQSKDSVFQHIVQNDSLDKA